MTELRQGNAIRTRVWIGGRLTERDPVPVQLSQKRFEAKTTTSNMAMRVDRPFVIPGFPNIRNRRQFVLPWNDLREPGLLEHLDILTAVGQPFGLGLWKQEYDVFDGDGENTTFYLQRRQLLPQFTPDVVLDDYPTRVIFYDRPYWDPNAVNTGVFTVVQKDPGSIDVGDPGGSEAWIEAQGSQLGTLWVSKMRLGTPPPDAADCLIAMYLPLYTVLVDTEGPRNYAQALMEPRTLRLYEFG